MKYSIKVTRQELDQIVRGLECSMGEFLDDFGDARTTKYNNQQQKENDKIQKFINQLEKEFKG